MLPLYQGHKIPSDDYVSRNLQLLKAHPGLWFERLFNTYDNHYVVIDEAKTKFLKGLKSISGHDGRCGHREYLENALLQRMNLVDACKGKILYRRAAWHFVTGLGMRHPVENSLLFHTTLAVPYLPGSNIKGLVRAWIERELENPQEALWRIFGSEDKDASQIKKENTTGEILFFDALPVQPVSLLVDTITPHMSNWYEKGDTTQTADSIPADWHDPIPIPFLAVNDVFMHFSFVPRVQRDDTLKLLELVEYALDQALQTLGAGAKTGSGYGVFLPPTKEQQQLVDKLCKHREDAKAEQSKAHERNKLSEQARRLAELQEKGEIPKHQPPNTGAEYHRELYEVVLDAKQWPATEKKELAAFARSFFKKYASKKKQKEYMEAVRDLEAN